ncbi:MAG TPA: hypothetical protein VEV45_20825 [Streptosporangiaceae bacterium]|nr:hypothetical protein [Streptosporangiaceae bacterium]
MAAEPVPEEPTCYRSLIGIMIHGPGCPHPPGETVLVWGDCGMDVVPRDSDHGYLQMQRVPADLVDDNGITYRPGCER